MKKLVLTLATVIGAFALTACQSTSSSPSPAVASTCTLNYAGQSVDQNGNPCQSTTGTCAAQGLTYNSSTGQWINPSTGYPVACSNAGLTTGLGGGSTGGCTYWDSVYPGTQYIPMVDPTTGNLVCINVSSSGYNISIPPSYNYSTPVYGSTCPYTPYNDPNWQYDCSANTWQYSGSNYGYSGGSGVCLGVGAGDGSDYGYGSGYFGICF